jgi:hypothetical protein
MYGAGDGRVENVPDPSIVESTDANHPRRPRLHLRQRWAYKEMPMSETGQSMGHEAIRVVEDVRRLDSNQRPGG